jgi:hypothetical protein
MADKIETGVVEGAKAEEIDIYLLFIYLFKSYTDLELTWVYAGEIYLND